MKDAERLLAWMEERLPGGWRRGRLRKLTRIWAIGIAASAIVTAVSQTGLFEGRQAATLDFVLQLAGRQWNSDVVIVALDDRAFDRFGQRQPIPRDYLARVLRGLQAAGASVVGMDIAFPAPTSVAEDTALARAIDDFGDGQTSRVVLTSILPTSGALAEAAFGHHVVRGSPNVLEDSDGTVRRAILLFRGAKASPEPSLALAVIARYRGLDPLTVAGRLDVGNNGEATPINFAGPAKTFLTIPSDVVAALGEKDAEIAADNPLRGRIVLVGATFAESRDFFATPRGRLSGVEVHANVVHMVLNGRFIRPVGWPISFALQLATVLVTGVVIVYARPVVSNALCVAVPVLLAVPLSIVAFKSGGYWVDFILPVAATKLVGSGMGRLERRRLRSALERYVSKEVAAQVLAEAASLEGERREVSILFSDLRGFTTLSETMSPETVAAQLNQYFERMTRAIFTHRGMVNDFIGDAVMAIFGAPISDSDHAVHAVRAGMDMEAGLRELNAQWEKEGRPTLRMGIGIHSGTVFAGNVGGPGRLKYTIIGDAVNLASRVESINKDLETTMLVTASTLERLGAGITTRDRGLVTVKGRKEPVRLYEILERSVDGAVAPVRGGS